MIKTQFEVQNADGSKTKMVFIDDENGHGYTMTESDYDANEAKTK